jgi:ribokinase
MKNAILISGLINIETSLRVTEFPLEYFPVTYPFFGVSSTVAGVGYNIAKALITLGDRIRLLSIIGKDDAAQLVKIKLIEENIPWKYVLSRTDQTAQSVIIYDSMGRRQIHTDLKNIQDLSFPQEMFAQALADTDICILCNINFSRSLLQPAKNAGKLIATDVHTISNLNDEYNRDFMQAADILFLSNEKLPGAPEQFIRDLWEHYPAEIVVIGLGGNGAMLGTRKDHAIERIPAVHTRSVRNTIGAGDALFSSFMHCFSLGLAPYDALQKAVVFASYKIGVASASDGFLTGDELDKLSASLYDTGL